MRVVSGIDAAWTATRNSSVAIAVEKDGGWKLHTVAPSFGRLFAHSDSRQEEVGISDQSTTAAALIDAKKTLVGKAPDLVAIDMPLAYSPITMRREADRAISREFGAQWCSTHSPNAARPGLISDQLRSGFAAAGYPLCTQNLSTPGLIEVYPHPALVRLTGEPVRLPYKIGRIGPKSGLTPEERALVVIAEWTCIALVLDAYIDGVSDWLQGILQTSGKSRKALKAIEDMLDAIICCVCAIRALDGAAEAYGDQDSAIWVPHCDEVLKARTLLPSSPYSARAKAREQLFANALARGEYDHLYSAHSPRVPNPE